MIDEETGHDPVEAARHEGQRCGRRLHEENVLPSTKMLLRSRQHVSRQIDSNDVIGGRTQLAEVSTGAAADRTDVLPTVRRVYDAFGPQRLLWGTGFVRGENVGRIPYGQELELIREHVPFFTPEDQEWILGRTAMTLWHFRT